jgi:hypothetical protein
VRVERPDDLGADRFGVATRSDLPLEQLQCAMQ